MPIWQTARMRVDAYTRLSRLVPDETSTARQEADCRKFADLKGWKVDQVHTDVDFSAYTGKPRPGFEQLCQRVEDGEVDAIVFWKLDRLVRNHTDFERLWALCELRGVVLASVKEPIDTTTEIGMVVVRLLVSFARLESATISMRVKAQREEAARTGRPPRWTRRPFGLTADWTEVVPDEAEAVREGARLILDGHSAYSVAEAWNASGLVSPTGKPWRSSTVVQCLTAPRIAAQRVYRGEVVGPGDWPALLDDVTYARLYATLKDPRRRSGGGGPGRNLLSGLVRCHCGTSMSIRPNAQKVRRYLCRRDIGGCGAGINADRTEAHVVELVFGAIESGELERALDDSDTDGTLEAIRADEALLGQLIDDHTDGRISRGEWLRARDKVEARLEASRRKVARWAPQVQALTRAEWEARDLPWRRGALRMVLDSVVIGPTVKGGFDADRIQPEWRV